MVLLLNLIVPAVVGFSAWCFWKTRKVVWIFVILVFVFLYARVQPTYMPKGDITRTSVPEFPAPRGEIQDRNRKPVPSEIRNAEQMEAYKRGLPFIEQKQ